MKNSSKAFFLTAFVLPGLGHYILKRYISAVILIGVSLVLLYVLISTTIKQARLISDQILMGEIQPDLQEITRLAFESPTGDGANSISYVTTALIVVWALALLDIFRLSRQ
ncbi:MAG: hypothetical protein ACI9CO_001540 [Candidatus Azotimanducaceae bacterium]|jgi:hypothetical protein